MVDWTGKMRTYKRTDTYIHARYSYWKVGTVGIRTAGVYSGLLCIAMFINGFCFLLFFSFFFVFYRLLFVALILLATALIYRYPCGLDSLLIEHGFVSCSLLPSSHGEPMRWDSAYWLLVCV